jgi:regulatory protein
MKITKISQQIKNENRANIFIDGKYYFSLTVSQLFDSGIKVHDEIDEAKLATFKKMSQDGKLKIRTLEWLMIRPRSQKELHDYLYRKKVDTEDIGLWIKEFQKKSYQNDESFASWWVEQRRSKKRSAKFIKSELRAKGIKSEMIDDALATSLVDDKLALKELVAKKRLLLKYQDDKKLIEYLIRQGYYYSLIKEVLAE